MATEEQLAVAATVASGAGTVVVQAFAGTGKTTALRTVAGARDPTKVLYVCFGRETERRFGATGVRSTTFDALCFRHFGETRPPAPINRWTVRDELGISDELAEPVADRLNDYAVDVNAEPLDGHAETMWDRLSPGGSGKHSCFARLRRAFYDDAAAGWSLGYDLLLVDECQDLNPVMLESLLLFAGQRVFVGDRYQHIFGFMGTVDAFERLETIPNRASLRLTRSFRFGRAIADLASEIVNVTPGRPPAEPVAIRGEGPPGEIGRAHGRIPSETAVLAVKNATLLRMALDAAERGRTIHLLGRDSFLDLVEEEYRRYLRDGPAITQSRMVGAQLREEADRAGALQAVLGYGTDLPDKLDRVRRASVGETDADLILCTIHKSKGLEWDRVWLVDDLEVGRRGRERNARELLDAMDEKNRLYYVGVTRAKNEVLFPDSLRREFRMAGAPPGSATLKRFVGADRVVDLG